MFMRFNFSQNCWAVALQVTTSAVEKNGLEAFYEDNYGHCVY
jgi:hypothetical protein